MSDPSAKTHTNESRHTISEVESFRQELKMLEAERDRMRDALEQAGRDICNSMCALDYADDPHCRAHKDIIAALTQREGGKDDHR